MQVVITSIGASPLTVFLYFMLTLALSYGIINIVSITHNFRKGEKLYE